MTQTIPLFERFDCDDWGFEPICFYALGHIDKAEFLNASAICEYLHEQNQKRDFEINPEEIALEPEQVQHAYWRVDSDELESESTEVEIFQVCQEKCRGAFAVTFIDLN
ncbi:hypothetical protein C7B80_06060 [Cyanosarcina cf. burmensis CCALA 770]|jgi:hypothetical protein|nr:hypothetical protein C7B80_06060 [Cyanosarcina cf. burmensis CCALA 770]